MTRYRALRLVGCDILTAATISFLNWIAGYPSDQIRFMHITIEIEP